MNMQVFFFITSLATGLVGLILGAEFNAKLIKQMEEDYLFSS
jgi:hypothetical protein